MLSHRTGDAEASPGRWESALPELTLAYSTTSDRTQVYLAVSHHTQASAHLILPRLPAAYPLLTHIVHSEGASHQGHRMRRRFGSRQLCHARRRHHPGI